MDLVLIHYPKANECENNDPENVNIRKDCWKALEEFTGILFFFLAIFFLESIIHSIGVSNYEACHIEEIIEFGTKIPAVNQLEFTPHFTRIELQNYCKEKGIYFCVINFLIKDIFQIFLGFFIIRSTT